MLPDGVAQAQVEVFDVEGKRVAEVTTKGSEIDMRHLRDGVYLARVQAAGKALGERMAIGR